jgi:hypothetical protein
VDGTCEGDSPNLFCGVDGIRELVLDTIKIPSEKKEQLIPFFRRIKQQYGDPKALVHDMGQGICMAVQEVFPGVADFICHFHFLRDVGKDLLQDEYTALQKRLQQLNVRALLRQKARYLEQKIDPTAPVTAHRLLKQIMEVRLRGIVKDNKPYNLVYRALDEAVNDNQLNDLAASLERKAKSL